MAIASSNERQAAIAAAIAKMETDIRAFFQEAVGRRERKHNQSGWNILSAPLADITPLQMEYQAPAGMGKTTLVTRLIAEELKGAWSIWWLEPTLNMAKAVVEMLREQGVEAMLVQGRNESMCNRHDEAAKVAELGLRVPSVLCKKCQYAESCGYMEQQSVINEAEQITDRLVVYVMAHSYLAYNSPAPAPHLVIVDEAHWQCLIKITSIRTDELISFVDTGIAGHIEYKAFVQTVANTPQAHGLSKQPECLKHLRACGITAAYQFQPVLKYLHRLQHKHHIKENKNLENTPYSAIRHAIGLFKSLQAEIEIKRDTAHTVICKVDSFEVCERKSPFGRFDGKNCYGKIKPLTPVLIIDASADPAINRQIWGKYLQHKSLLLERNAIINQVANKTFSRQSIIGKGKHGAIISSQKETEAELLRQQLVEFIGSLPGKIFVAGTLAVIKALSPLLPSKIKTSHFSALRGRNDFEGCDTVVVIGREQPSPQAVEAYARALWWDTEEPLLLGHSEYSNAPQYIQLRDGSKKLINVQEHPDRRVQAVLHQTRECEMEQAIDRPRLIHNPQPKTVYVLCRIPLYLTVDRLWNWKDLQQGGRRIERAIDLATRKAKAMPLGASELARLFPQLWNGRNAVKSDIERGGGIKWVESQINIYWGNDPLIWVEYRRPNQRGKPSPAVISAKEPDHRQALEAVVGGILTIMPMEELYE